MIALDFMDYYNHPPITLWINQSIYNIEIIIDPPSKLTEWIKFLLSYGVDLDLFLNRLNTKELVYSVKASIEQVIQRWKATGEYASDRWPEVSVVIGKPNDNEQANFYYCGENFIYKG